MKSIRISLLLGLSVLLIFSCKKVEKKPFGAETIDYDKVEAINKEGPNMETQHFENTPPISDKTTIVELGPPQIDYSGIIIEPTADKENYPDYGGIPIVIKENNNNGS